jgi:hypothetical protein
MAVAENENEMHNQRGNMLKYNNKSISSSCILTDVIFRVPDNLFLITMRNGLRFDSQED